MQGLMRRFSERFFGKKIIRRQKPPTIGDISKESHHFRIKPSLKTHADLFVKASASSLHLRCLKIK